MNPTRPMNLDSGLRPAAATPAVSLTGERRSPLPRLEPDVARVRPLDRDSALRILIEEVKSALIERFGALPNTLALARPGADSSSLLSDLARLLNALLSNLAGEGEGLPDQMLELAEEAVLIGGRRAMDTISQLPLVDVAVQEAVEQMRWLLVRMVTVQAQALRRSTGHPPDEPSSSYSRLPNKVERDQGR
jgi:hypothetical protein